MEAAKSRHRREIYESRSLKVILPEMNFCRRCGTSLINKKDHVFVCQNGHTIYANCSPAVALLLFNHKEELAVLTRAIDPGKGKLDFPGGFCDGNEPLQDAVHREIKEEIGVSAQQYTELEFLHSGIDPYDLDGETLSVVAAIFTARCTEDVTLIAADDAASAEFRPLNDINLRDIYFPSLRQALTILKERISA